MSVNHDLLVRTANQYMRNRASKCNCEANKIPSVFVSFSAWDNTYEFMIRCDICNQVKTFSSDDCVEGGANILKQWNELVSQRGDQISLEMARGLL
jgi:hypothetical protein